MEHFLICTWSTLWQALQWWIEIANDYEYECVFRMQLAVYAEPDDLLIIFSCSGNSPNVVNVKHAAQRMNIEVIEMFGADGESYQDAETRHLALVHQISRKVI